MRHIQANCELYWIQVVERKSHSHACGYIPPDEKLACRIGGDPKLFPWHMFDDLCVVVNEKWM